MGCGASAPSPPVGTPTPRTTSGPTKGADMHSIDQQMKCEKHTEEEILEEKLGKLFEALRQPNYPKLRKSHLVDPASSQAGIINEDKKAVSAVLADGLVALGISRRADAFINDLFDGVTDGNTEELDNQKFKYKVKEERQISLRFLFLHNLNLNPKLSVFYFFTCLHLSTPTCSFRLILGPSSPVLATSYRSFTFTTE